MELVAEPGRELAGMQAVEPERNRAELDRHRIEVDAEAVAVGDEGADLLLLDDDLVLRDGPAGLLLLALEVEVGELVRRLDQERGRPHRRLEDLEFEDLVGAQVLAALHAARA